MSAILFATDLDKTLVGDDVALTRLNQIIIDLKSTHDLKLAYVTGRSLELFNELTNDKELLAPDALVTSVGTEIRIDGEKLTNWPNVQEWDADSIRNILLHYPSLTLQPTSEQGAFKISYFVEDDELLIDSIRNELRDYPVDVVYSMSLYLDIVPAGINKGSALKYLAEKWYVEPANVYACGDSGNDIDMLASSNAIIVANAKKELLDWAENQTGPVYKAGASYAEGIIEGLKHYKLI